MRVNVERNMKKDEKFIAVWSNLRALGLFRYTLLVGVMGWGSSCALLMIVLISSIGLHEHPLTHLILTVAILFPLAGIIFGSFMYSFNENRFQDLGGKTPQDVKNPKTNTK